MNPEYLGAAKEDNFSEIFVMLALMALHFTPTRFDFIAAGSDGYTRQV